VSALANPCKESPPAFVRPRMTTGRLGGAPFAVRFGKKEAKRDARNFEFKSLVLRAPPLPRAYDFDRRYAAVPTPMFGNDLHGDCVIAGRAHQTLRFEYLEQRAVLEIRNEDVLREWHRENHDTEDGLAVLDSLKEWRTEGWRVGSRTYTIKAFAELDRKDHDEIRRAIVMQVGVGIGLSLPDSALPMFEEGRRWDVVSGPDSYPDPFNGHYVYCPAYAEDGPKHPMTWAFFERYCDEAYAMIDARDAAARDLLGLEGELDHQRLDALLRREA
jgi:hypothetical protein